VPSAGHGPHLELAQPAAGVDLLCCLATWNSERASCLHHAVRVYLSSTAGPGQSACASLAQLSLHYTTHFWHYTSGTAGAQQKGHADAEPLGYEGEKARVGYEGEKARVLAARGWLTSGRGWLTSGRFTGLAPAQRGHFAASPVPWLLLSFKQKQALQEAPRHCLHWPVNSTGLAGTGVHAEAHAFSRCRSVRS